MKLLRDKSLSTQILTLYEIHTNDYSKLTPIAEKIGVTQQAISYYMKKLMQQGLAQKIDKKYKPTIKGIYLLQNELSNLKYSIDDQLKNMTLIKDCIALARNKIKKGDAVGLFMEDGWLVAYSDKKSSSKGMAKKDANVGEYVTIGNLEGIIDHSVGKLSYFELPNPFNSHQIKIDLNSLKKNIYNSNVDKVGILDLVAKSICQKIGVKPDFEFDATHAAIDSANRGLNTALIGYENNILESIKIVVANNEKHSEKISYDIISIK